jgi:hypothetical protein
MGSDMSARHKWCLDHLPKRSTFLAHVETESNVLESDLKSTVGIPICLWN